MGEAQGKKVSPPPLRHRRSRRRRPLARSSHQRPGGSRRSDSTEEKTWRKSSNPHKRPPSWGEGKETLAYRRRHCMSGPRPHSARMADRVASTETPPQCDRALQRPRCGHALVAISVNNHPRNDERRGLSLGQPRQLMRRCHAGGNALSGVERGAESTMRAQAVAATMIAPATATVSRQPSADMPMWARPSAA